jgi:uncharacterized protein (DUF2147 family)
MRAARLAASVALSLLAAGAAGAARAEDPAPTPVGRWTTIDDKTGKPSSVVAIYEEDGKLKGKVETVIVNGPGDDPAPKCTKCEGALKDQPVIGMVILWDLAKDGKRWTGGRILDPDEGSVYKCRVEPVENGQKLEVRGYIGISLLGRTQTWIRAK